MSRLRLPLVILACWLFWALLGALLGALVRHPLVGLVGGLLFGLSYVVFGSWAAEKFPADVWDAQLLENMYAPNLYEMLEALCEKTGMPLPTLYSCPYTEPNAFVTASREGNTAVIITNGLTRHLEKDEVQAILALMIARLATEMMPSWVIGATLAGLPLHLGRSLQKQRGLEWLGTGLLSIFVFPAVGLTRLVWDERIVTASDHHAAHLVEHPGALERALAKVEAGRTEEQTVAGNPATAFLFAVSPLVSPPPAAPFWRKTLEALPFCRPTVSERTLSLASIVLPQSVDVLPQNVDIPTHRAGERWGL